MIVGDIGLRTLSGPITIAQGAGASVVVGLQYYLGFLALISISLGVLNLLPIPVLDGGHLLYYVIEIITRRPVSEKVQMVSFKIGMLLLLFLMTIAFYNDLLRLF
jgi:regulator of sigma E protease